MNVTVGEEEVIWPSPQALALGKLKDHRKMPEIISWPQTFFFFFFFFSFPFFFFFFFFFFVFVGLHPTAYGGSQVRGLIRATAASLYHSHSNTGSEPYL